MQGLSCKVVGRLDVLDRIFGAVFDFYVRDGIVVIRMRNPTIEMVDWEGSILIVSELEWNDDDDD